MKKLLVLTFCMIGATTVGQAQEFQSKGEPKIKFETKKYDFGAISSEEKAVHEFRFENTGDGPLVIQDVNPSCGCTTPEWPKQPIKPGESGKIKAVFDASGKNGKFDKSIKIVTNVPFGSEKTLHIQGQVQND